MTTDQQASADRAELEALRRLPMGAWEDGSVLPRLLELWRRQHGRRGVALYSADPNEGWSRRAVAGQGTFPARLEPASGAQGISLPGDALLVSEPPSEPGPPHDELSLLLATGARLSQLTERLKAQSFQENYKVVKLEALYDVGLAIGSTLNLEELYEEILLRAVSLLDARRGALYLLGDGEYRLNRTIGGSAAERLPAEQGKLEELLEPGGLDELLPGASYISSVPITLDREGYGLLVVADKESRRGVGPFVEADRRALSMFAAQAAIALENAALHRQALEKERLERELELAAEIQRGLLPAMVPCLGGMEIVGWNRPSQQVGGDYYGFLKLGAGTLGIVVADVTGKGMPAALLVSTLHSALHLLLDRVDLGAELLSRLNEHIADSSASNKFITLILVEVDERSGQIGFLNAGHNPGLLVRRDGRLEQLDPGGLPLGLMHESRYRFDRLVMEKGDLLCLYSDGITECLAPNDEEFGLDRLVAFLKEHRELPLQELLSRLDQQVAEFADGMPQGDDQTVVFLRRT